MSEFKEISILNPVDLRLRRIADVLHLNASFIDKPGLLNGKMGIAIFLYHYARKYQSEMYENYAGELIDEIYEEINPQTPVGFSNGLTGIGWGIEYLVRNGFVEADTDEVLNEMDSIIYREMLKQPVLLENNNDLFGYGLYILARLHGKKIDDNNLTTLVKKQHLIYLTDECERLLIYKRYLDFNILSMRVGTINSIAWFLLEMNKSGLFPSKVDKLIRHLPSELEFTLKTYDDSAQEYVLWQLLQNFIPLVSDNEIKEKYTAYANMVAERWREASKVDDNLTGIFSSMAWLKLLYSPYLKEDTFLTNLNERVFNIIDNEDNWSNRLDTLNKDNIGLNGLAGVGLGLMNGII
jgi:hypothetical protein